MLLIVLFWLLFALVVYTYLGYGLLLWGIVRVRRALGIGQRVLPPMGEPADVTLVVPAYNEIDCLPAKLQNCLDQDYPAHRLHLLFVVEGSTDGSAEWLEAQRANVPNLTILSGTDRLGKIVAMNKAMKRVNTPLVIFTDANTHLNPEAVSRLVRKFDLPNVGAVTGEKRIQMEASEAATGSGEGLYWKYESFLKRLDAELHTIVGAAGELFAIRTGLFEPVEADTLLDDFMISLRIAARGYRVEYEPNAYALERPSAAIREEQKRKVRIATGGFQSIARLLPLFNISRYGWLSFQYVSHRVLRWAVTPFCLPLLLLLNALILLQLVYQNASGLAIGFWAIMFLGQLAFYSLAWIGYRLEDQQTRWKPAFVPFYFTFMNWCVLQGFVRYRRGGLSGIWEKATRAA
ncbi:Biofilm PIA synthesis N-glycosyltransferase icaA [Fibrella aestuarina BUZ 2]|uniref:Biofilm PIA synthesis N-glycosyltransferase icaA n=1 Tax=Fibrella aestuarina BUZ 2 TaxID=1166018 RepID=I0K3L1_9BACT|nr:glycosyltransferase family 2 protein [Fibrella aestuarina]CCG98714.1 Biofilm PIA synthesis N-glycosyltransferase icaA [Fibrella aestuarina BUZ 2]